MGNKVLTVEINANTSKLEASFKKVGEISKVFNAAEASTVQIEEEKNRLLQEQAKLLQKGVDIADKIKAMPEKMQLSAMNAYLLSANKQMERLASQAAKVNTALSQSYLKDIASSSKATQANTATLLANQYIQPNQELEKTKTKVAAIAKEHKNILTHVGEIIVSYRLLNSTINLVEQALVSIPKAGMELQATQASIFGVLGTDEGRKSLTFIRETALNAGLSLLNLEEAYRRFAPSAILAGAKQEEVNKSFKDFAEVGKILHLPQEKLNSLFLALEQMYAKGVVQSEEIKKQLGNVLPGAVEMGAKAIGKTPAAFMDAMKKNLVITKDFVPKLAELYRTTLGGPGDAVFESAKKSLDAQLNNIQTTWTIAARKIFEVTQATMSDTVGLASQGIQVISNNITGILQVATLAIAALAPIAATYIASFVAIPTLVAGAAAALIYYSNKVQGLSTEYSEASGFTVTFENQTVSLTSYMKETAIRVWEDFRGVLQTVKTSIEDLANIRLDFSNLLPNMDTFIKFLAHITAMKQSASLSPYSPTYDEAFKKSYEELTKHQEELVASRNAKTREVMTKAAEGDALAYARTFANKSANDVSKAISEGKLKSLESIKLALADTIDTKAPASLKPVEAADEVVNKATKAFNLKKALVEEEIKLKKEASAQELENAKADYDRNLISFAAFMQKKVDIELGGLLAKKQMLQQELSVANERQKPSIQGEINRTQLEIEQKGVELTRERNDLEQKLTGYKVEGTRKAVDLTKAEISERESLQDRMQKAISTEKEYYAWKLAQQGLSTTEIQQQIEDLNKVIEAEKRKERETATNKAQAKLLEGANDTVDVLTKLKDISSGVWATNMDGISKVAEAFANLPSQMQGAQSQIEKFTTAFNNIDNNPEIVDKNQARVNGLELIKKAETAATDTALGGIQKILAASQTMTNKRSGLAKGLHTVEVTLAMARMALHAKEQLESMKSIALNVIGGASKFFEQSGWLGFAGVAAMIALLAGLGYKAANPNNSGYIPDSKDFGTVLGDSQSKSESTKNVYDLLKEIHAREYFELKGINAGVNQLTKGISSWVTKFFQGGGLQIASAPKFKNTVLDSMTKLDPLLGSIWKNDPTINFAAKFLMGVPKIVAQGIYIAKQNLEIIGDGIDIIAKEFIDIEQKGLLFSSKKTVFRPLNQLLVDGLTDIFVGAKKTLRSTIQFFGVDLQDMVTQYILPRIKINLKGKSAEKVTEKMTNVLSTALDKMTDTIMGDVLRRYQQLGEGLYETAIRIQAQAIITKDFFKKIGSSITLTNSDWADLSQDLVDLATDSGTAADRLKQLREMMNNFISTFAPETVQNTQKFTAFAGDLAFAFSKLKGDNAQQLADGFYTAITSTKDLGTAIYNFTASLGTSNTEVVAEMLKLGDAAKDMAKFFGETLKPVNDQIKTLTDSIDTTPIEDLMATLSNSKDINEQKALVGQLQKKIMDKYNTELNSIKTIKNALYDLSKTVKRLLLGDLSTLDPRQKFKEAEKQYLDLLAQVNSSDVVKAAEAAGQLGSAAETYLQEAKKYYGATESYAAIFQAVTNTLNTLSGGIVDKDQAIIDATKDLATAAIGQLNTLATTYVDAFKAYLAEQIDIQKNQIPPDRQPTFLEGLYKTLADAIGSGDKAKKKEAQRMIDAYQLGGQEFYDAVLGNNAAEIARLQAKAAEDIKTQQSKIEALNLEKKDKNTTKARKDEITAEVDRLNALIAKEKKLIKFKADGGISSGYTIVGERGPELLYLPTNTKVINNTNTNRMLDNARKEELEYLAGIREELSTLNSRMAVIERKTRLTNA